jgi:molybdenum cofactor cytidylyltransferase
MIKNNERISIDQMKEEVVKGFNVSGKRHLLITGSKGIGKTTLLREILKDRKNYGGINTRLVFEKADHPEYLLLEDALDYKKYTIIGKINNKFNRMIPIIDGFETFGVETLKKYRKSSVELIIFDEIGYLEETTTNYQEEIFNCFNEKEVIAIIRKESNIFLDKIKILNDTYIIDLDDIIF